MLNNLLHNKKIITLNFSKPYFLDLSKKLIHEISFPLFSTNNTKSQSCLNPNPLAAK